jgi:hypothetical protein
LLKNNKIKENGNHLGLIKRRDFLSFFQNDREMV